MDRLEPALAGSLLGRVGVQSPPMRIEGPVAGVHSNVFRVECADGQRLALKVFKDESAAQLARERRVLEILEPLPVRVPRVVGADDTRELLPWAYLALTDLGEVLSRQLEAGMSREQLLRFNRELGAGLRALHAHTFDHFGAIGARAAAEGADDDSAAASADDDSAAGDGSEDDPAAGEYATGEHAGNSELMFALFDAALKRFVECGGSERLEWRVRDYVLANGGLFDHCTRAVLCHLDCHETNIAVSIGADGPSFAGLLDFGNAIAGDPLLDLSKTHYMARRGNSETLVALLTGYCDLPPDWHPVFRLYTLLHAVSCWNWFADNGYNGSLSTLERDIRRLTGASWRAAPRGARALP